MMEISSVTTKFQATIPLLIRERLGLKRGDKLGFSVAQDGRVYIEKTTPLDRRYLQHVSQTLAEEWLSPEDCQAYDDL